MADAYAEDAGGAKRAQRALVDRIEHASDEAGAHADDDVSVEVSARAPWAAFRGAPADLGAQLGDLVPRNEVKPSRPDCGGVRGDTPGSRQVVDPGEEGLAGNPLEVGCELVRWQERHR